MNELAPFGQLPIEERVAMFRAYQEGRKIQAFCQRSQNWVITPHPTWVDTVIYRFAPEPAYINWDHVAPEWVAMATDAGGKSYLYNSKELVAGEKTEMWGAAVNVDFVNASVFASSKPGTCDWRESLVLRPEVHSMKIGDSVNRFINYYKCTRCNTQWEEESDCTNDDRCPECNLAMAPHTSEDLNTDPPSPKTPFGNFVEHLYEHLQQKAKYEDGSYRASDAVDDMEAIAAEHGIKL